MKIFFNSVLKGLVVISTISYSCHSEGQSEAACYYEGKIYEPGERIPREEACHICLCHRGRVDCAWMNCPPPPDGCKEMTLPEECNPALYVCPIPRELTQVASAWIRRLKRASDIKPADAYIPDGRGDANCKILGVPYRTGDLVGVASHPCLECRCARDELYCSPRCCFRALNLDEGPRTVLQALSRGSRLPEKHPLDHLWKEQDKLWD